MCWSSRQSTISWLAGSHPCVCEDVPLVEAIKDPHEDLSFLLKSAFDRLLASVLFVVSVPILGVAAVLIASTSRGADFLPPAAGWQRR